MNNDIDQVKQKIYRYWYVDGVTEIGFGIICLLLGVYFFVQATYPKESTLYRIFDLGLVFIIFGAGLAGSRFIGLFKNRITYPRTGYISYKKASGKYRWLTALLGMVIGSLAAGLVINAPESIAWMPAVSGLILAAVLLFIAARAGLLRFYLLSAASAAIGIGLSLAGIGDILGLSYFYLFTCLALFASGGATLWIDLHSTRLPTEAAEG